MTSFRSVLTHICFLPDEWKHETSGSNKQDLKVSAFIQINIIATVFENFNVVAPILISLSFKVKGEKLQ